MGNCAVPYLWLWLWAEWCGSRNTEYVAPEMQLCLPTDCIVCVYSTVKSITDIFENVSLEKVSGKFANASRMKKSFSYPILPSSK